MRRHVAAFNAKDIDALMACFDDDVTWITGTDTLHGANALRELFVAAFEGLLPRLHLLNLLVQGDLVACELREDYVAGSGERTDHTDHIAGFYRVEAGLITQAKIYREGSADV